MSFWVHAFCNESVASVTPDDLKNGIRRRLKALTYLFCPDDEEDPDVVFERLRIEDHSASSPFQEYRMYYRADSPVFIHVGRYGREAVEEVERDALPRLYGPPKATIRQMLAEVKEDVTFCLKTFDVNGMGFPLTIAAAAFLVEQHGGLIQSGRYSWMVPDRNEVKILLEVNA